MKLEVFVICDAATDHMGKFNILGAFDHIVAPTEPVVLPRCAVAIRFRLTFLDEGHHHLRLRLMNPDAKPCVPEIDANFQTKIPAGRDSIAMNLILNMQNLRFEKFDDYLMELLVDNQSMSTLPITVISAKKAPPFPGMPHSP